MDDHGDLYLRQSLLQPGVAHAGGTASPDIVPRGTTVEKDPSVLLTDAAWTEDCGAGLVPGCRNHVYVRTRNPAGARRKGRIFLGAAPPSYLCWPDTLRAVKAGSKGYADVDVAGGKRGVTMGGFDYQPDAAGETLASWIYTLEHPVQLPETNDINVVRDFIAGTPAYAQRNVGFGLDGDGYRYTAAYEQRSVAAIVVFELAWENCPSEWALSLLPVAGDEEVAIDTFRIGTVPGSSVTCQRQLPAGFTTSLRLAIDTGGVAPGAKSVVQTRVSLLSAGAGIAAHGSDRTQALRLFLLGGHCWRSQPGAPSAALQSIVQGVTHE